MNTNNQLLQRLTTYRSQRLSPTRRAAAVMLLVVSGTEDGPALLLTRRQAAMRSYACDWCLPGGRCAPEDISLLSCAWRELQEETGIGVERCSFLAVLDDFYDGRGELVRPYVGLLDAAVFRQCLQLQASEVIDCLLLPLARLHQLQLDESGRFPARRRPAYVLALDEDGSKGHVWGLTASILRHFQDVMTGSVSPLCKGESFRREDANHES